VVVAYRGGRVDKAGEALRAKWKVEITPDVGSLCRRVDAVLIGSGEGSGRLEQIKAVIAAGKPMFLDSPLAGSLDEAQTIVKLVKDSGLSWFSASGFRFGEIAEIKASYFFSANAWGPSGLDRRAIEILYALMGAGCEEVAYATGPQGETLTGRWAGRTGTVSSGQPDGGWGVEVARSKEAGRIKYRIAQDYRSLLVEIVKFFEGGPAPVSPQETLEALAFLDAAERSKAAGGAPMKLR
jgi:predicted dehydrogenase